VVAARRDDITGAERAHMALTCWAAQGQWDGTPQRLAEQYRITRQSVHNIVRKARKLLPLVLEPGPHGRPPAESTVLVNRNRLVRGTVALTGAGVSQRGVTVCLEELLDTQVSPSWVNAALVQQEQAAAVVNARWQPALAELLAGDEIYSHGQPNLLVVGNDSLYIYALTRQPACDETTWGCVLLDAPACPQLASDGGPGLAAGAKAAEIEVHQLDWDHLLRPLWGQVSRLEQQAYAALEAVEARATQFDRAQTPKRLAQHLAVWERLGAEAEDKIARYDAFVHIAQQVDDWFALIDLDSGQLRDPGVGAASLRHLGDQLRSWAGRIYEKLSRNLASFAEGLFSYQPVLAEALAPLIEQWGAPAIHALSRIWQIEADEKRHPVPLTDRRARHQIWAASLDEAVLLLGEEQLWAAWEALSAVLGRTWRGSMMAECVNSLLRPVLDGRKHSDQGCLELFRLLHNTHSFARGKRAGRSPAELVGLSVPDDPLTLLGLEPKCKAKSP
jgi:hypothetical protein